MIALIDDHRVVYGVQPVCKLLNHSRFPGTSA